MLSNLFKYNRNHKDISPFVILPKVKPIPFCATSSNDNKVKFNPNFNHSNLVL
jgi:hypothetical protein